MRSRLKDVYRFHDNRHTALTRISVSGAPVSVIKSIAGHVSNAMLAHYTHVRQEAKQKIMDRVELAG